MWLPVALLLSVVVMEVTEGRRIAAGASRPHGAGEGPVDDCGREPYIVRRVTLSHHRLECPARAVCGDQWDTIRDWYNGTRCADRRVLLHCLCPGDRECPVGNEDHMLHISKKHKQYLCEETCDVGTCGSFRRNAMQLVQFSPDFARKNYYKINCRCPGHSNPIRRRGLNRAVSFTGQYEADYRTGIRYVNYRCNRVLSLYANASNPADTGPQDPCRTS